MASHEIVTQAIVKLLHLLFHERERDSFEIVFLI